MVMEVRDVKLLFSKAMVVNYVANLSELKRSEYKLCASSRSNLPPIEQA